MPFANQPVFCLEARTRVGYIAALADGVLLLRCCKAINMILSIGSFFS